jgi:hypothetical protein
MGNLISNVSPHRDNNANLYSLGYSMGFARNGFGGMAYS